MAVVYATKVLAENEMQSDIVNGYMMISYHQQQKKLKPFFLFNQKQKMKVFLKIG